MGGKKIELVRKSIAFIINNLESKDRLALVTFNHSSEIIQQFAYMNRSNKRDMKRLIEGIGASGNTNIVRGLEDGLELLLDRRTVNDVSSIFFLSDGRDTSGNKQRDFKRVLDKYDRLLKRKEIDYKINSYGYGEDYDENILTLISNFKDGNFYYISKLEFIEDSVIDNLGFLLSVIANKAKITCNLMNNCYYDTTYGYSWNEIHK